MSIARRHPPRFDPRELRIARLAWQSDYFCSAAHANVLVLFQVRDGEVVRVRGTARYLQDAVTMRRVTRASLPKYVLRPRALQHFRRNLSRMSARAQYTRERTDTGMIEVTPESYAVGPA